MTAKPGRAAGPGSRAGAIECRAQAGAVRGHVTAADSEAAAQHLPPLSLSQLHKLQPNTAARLERAIWQRKIDHYRELKAHSYPGSSPNCEAQSARAAALA